MPPRSTYVLMTLSVLMPAVMWAPKPWSIIAALAWASFCMGNALYSWRRMRQIDRLIEQLSKDRPEVKR